MILILKGGLIENWILNLMLGIGQLCWVLATMGRVRFYIMTVEGAGAL